MLTYMYLCSDVENHPVLIHCKRGKVFIHSCLIESLLLLLYIYVLASSLLTNLSCIAAPNGLCGGLLKESTELGLFFRSG